MQRRVDVLEKLQSLIENNDYHLIQTNGQRIYCRYPIDKNPPPKNCEIHISNIKKDMFEDEIVPLLESIGPLYQFRMMLNFMEETRGFAFAMFYTYENAIQAVRRFNNYEVRKGVFLRVVMSTNNCRLFIGNLPPNKTKHEIVAKLRSLIEGIEEVVMYKDFNSKVNRGFAFVEFENHRFASLAKKHYAPDHLIVWNQRLYVDWARPLEKRNQNEYDTFQIKTLFLANVSVDCPLESIQNLIKAKTAITTFSVIRNFDRAYVEFPTHHMAKFALRHLKGATLEGSRIFVNWMRPNHNRNRLSGASTSSATSSESPNNPRQLNIQAPINNNVMYNIQEWNNDLVKSEPNNEQQHFQIRSPTTPPKVNEILNHFGLLGIDWNQARETLTF